MSVRAVPLCCPYCAEEGLEPLLEEAAWYCWSCDRRFQLRFKGLGYPEDA